MLTNSVKTMLWSTNTVMQYTQGSKWHNIQLRPFPAFGEPFEHVIENCVGQPPKTKTGNQFLLTVMCVSTRFLRPFPSVKITTPAITEALTKFF